MSLKEKIVISFAFAAIFAANFMIIKATAVHDRNERLEAEINEILEIEATLQNLRRNENFGNKD